MNSVNLDKYRGKKILILGLGREGLDNLRFFLDNRAGFEIGVADRENRAGLAPEIKELIAKDPAIRTHFGKDYLAAVKNYDLIVKTPGIPIHLPEIEESFARKKIISQTQIFFENYPGTIIGITGTKGKSTTSSIIYEILKAGGKKVFLGGNIGVPLLSYLKNAQKDFYFVYELSAHQLYGLRQSPPIAVLLNIYSEHLDYYKDLNEYVFAKANIALYQKKDDYLIYNSENQETRAIAQKAKSNKIAFNEYDWTNRAKTNLIGDFNLENAKVGAIIGRLLGISDQIINKAIEDFKPLENRLEFVGNFNGIDFYNDSLSTIQESAIAAIGGLGDRVQTLIAGGFDRGQPFDKLAAAILDSRIETLILFPATGAKIWEEVKKRAAAAGASRLNGLKAIFVEKMAPAADFALKETKAGRICLLSAASASFGEFKDYADRGRQYKNCVAEGARQKNQ